MNLNFKCATILRNGLVSILCLSQPSILMAQTNTTQSNPELQRAIEDSSGLKGTLNRLGLKNTKISGAEAFLDFNKSPGSQGQISTDGPTFVRFHLKAPPNFMEVHHRSGSDVMFT